MSEDNGAPKISNYELIRDKLLTIDPTAKIIGIADPSAPYVIDHREKYESLVKKGDIIQVGPGEKADYYIIKYAENKSNCYIITNDSYRDYKKNKSLKKHIIPVSIINEEVIFSEKLENLLKTIKTTNLII